MEYSEPFLNQNVYVKIDRPKGSKHPKHGFIYEVNYGYIPGTKAPDGEGLDAYVLGVDTPIDEFNGTCIAIIHRFNDDDDKLIVCDSKIEFTDEQITSIIRFQEKWFESEIIRGQ